MEFIHSDQAPKALGPYSQAVRSGDMLFLSGQLPMQDGTLLSEPGAAATAALSNLLAVIKAAGGKKENIVKIVVFVQDLDDFDAINVAYADFFGEHRPARSLVQVTRIPKDAILEIEAIAHLI